VSENSPSENLPSEKPPDTSHRVSKLSTACNDFAKFDYLFFKYFNK